MEYSLSSLSLTVDSMKQKLSAMPLVTQLPIGQGKAFTGFIDLLSMDVLLWKRGSDGVEFQCIPLLKTSIDGGTSDRDFSSIPSLLGPGWKFGDIPVGREEVEEALNHRSFLAEQVQSVVVSVFILSRFCTGDQHG